MAGNAAFKNNSYKLRCLLGIQPLKKIELASDKIINATKAEPASR